MFGYININKPELKIKDFFQYKAYYCGLCRSLKEKYGHLGQMTLTYDMTFLIILLTSLYEIKSTKEVRRCVIHPVKKHDELRNEFTDYVADINIALTYHHLRDDWQDDKSLAGLTGVKAMTGAYKKISKKYPRQCMKLSEGLAQLRQYELNNETNIDTAARCFGEIMGELFVLYEDRWEENLRKIGFYLGKYVYLMDAYDDLEKDIKKGSYNPLKNISTKDSYETECMNILTMMMAECTAEFEKLPCLMDIDLLRNILYEGVWRKYDSIQKEKNMKEGTKI